MKRFLWFEWFRLLGLLVCSCLVVGLFWVSLTQYPAVDQKTVAGIAIAVAGSLMLRYPRGRSTLARCYHATAVVLLGLIALFALASSSVLEKELLEVSTGLVGLSYYMGAELLLRRDRRRLPPTIECKD